MSCLRLGVVLAALVVVSSVGQTAEPQESAESIKKLILPGEAFRLEGRPAFVMLPPEEKRTSPQPWIMYAPTLPTSPDKHEKWMHEQFLAAGVAVAGIDAGEAYGSPEGQRLMSVLYEELTENRGFAPRPCLFGRSRGGLWVSSWAIANPNRVAGIIGIYPVYDLTTYPGLKRAAPAYELTPEELERRLAEYNPIERIEVLAKADIPVCIIHGDDDKVVPLKQNSAELRRRYQQAGKGGLVELIVVEGQGHNYWEGFFHCQSCVDFAIRQAKAGARPTAAAENRRRLQVPDDVEVQQDLVFSRPDGEPLRLDLYRPKQTEGRLPVVMWVHGGGWKQGSKERCPAVYLAQHGFAVASIQYRLTDRAQWPAQIDDCRAAVRWLRSHADEYGLDGERIGAWGGSAGGHLVALLGTLDTPADEAVSSRVQAVCDWYGPSDLLTMPPNVVSEKRSREQVAASNGAKLLGSPVPDVPELARQASALYQVSSDDPPFLIMHGEKDPGVPLEQSERLHDRLTQAGVSSTLHVVPGAGHGGKEFRTSAVRAVVRKFFEQHLHTSE
ncbi:Carboxylesterase NlhH [Maioricimonas rarisocia]|uniref:Carboxylesterase NlhH n=1 Tax=Maioricimonas rarisocia TaxID=2528026 RepID=A0A517Z3A2_9PLAN|nr:alpha/beta hydrolase [Maioricimonas rarisocia]QDU36959.1 Carboxylesterase NlhH [Maioricimonas rarisocia]